MPITTLLLAASTLANGANEHETQNSAPELLAAEDPAPAVEELAPVHGLTGDWGGWRTQLEERGITFGATFLFDGHQIVSGGLERGSLGHTFFDANVAFDLDRLFGLRDAVVVADAYIIHGQNPSDSVGDFQSFSNIAAGHVEQLSELYYEQYFHDQTWRLKLGKIDANGDFGAPDFGGEFVHSGAAYSPTNFVLPTYPNPATGIVVSWQPDEAWYVGVGAYDGATNAGIDTGSHGPSTFFGEPDDMYYIAECGVRWQRGTDELAGHAAAGFWHHTGEFARFTGGVDDGTHGFYGVLEQELARLRSAETPNTLAGFFQFGFADGDVATADVHCAAGIALAGCGARVDDGCGLYASYVHFSDDAGLGDSSETAFELFYKRQVAPWLVLEPDVQYIVNPGGDPAVDDAFVLTLRAQLDF